MSGERMIRRGRESLVLDRLDDAEAFFARATGCPDVRAAAWYGLGVVLYRYGDHEQATELFRNSLIADPSNADAYYFLGRIETQAGHDDAAVTLLRSALSLNPHHPSAAQELALLEAHREEVPRGTGPGATHG